MLNLIYRNIMMDGLPEDIQWHIWRIYYKEFVLNELIEEIKKRDATMIQTFVKNMIDEIVSEALNNMF